MSKSMSGLLVASPPSTSIQVDETVDDLDRVMQLPRRQPFVCTRDSNGQYAPRTSALIALMTARFSRGERLSCACRPRLVRLQPDGTLVIFRLLPEGVPPDPPLLTTVMAFVADQSPVIATEIAAAEEVKRLRPGGEVRLSAADGEIGHPCIKELNPTQSWSLFEAPKVGGLIGLVAVGSGKTATGILAPLAFHDCKLAVILAEPSQRQHYRSQYLRLRSHFRVPSLVLDDGPGYTVPGTPPLHFVPYSKLSHASSTDLLDRLEPDVVICDEAHRVSSISSRTRRLLRLLASRLKQREEAIAAGKPVRSRATRLLAWSGTLESKSIKDTQHLSSHALGTGSPLPLDIHEAERWSAVIDPVRQPDRTSPTARRLQEAFAGKVFATNSIASFLMSGPESAIRKGFRDRRMETCGVVSTTASAIGAAIYFKERKTPKIPDAVKAALARVREGERPDGDVLVDQSEIVRCVRDVSSGYFFRWVFRKEDSDELIADWYAKRKLWCRELRGKLLVSEVHMDSPLLCTNAAMRFWQEPKYDGDLPTWASQHWPAWAEIKDKVTYRPDVVWIDDYLARDAAEWAKANRGIVWYLGDAFGRRVADLAGLHCHGGGADAEALIKAETGKKSIVASVAAHGAGRDGLQFLFDTQLIAQMSSSNGRIEQLLGRLHREGQPSDSINVEYYLPVSEVREALRRVIAQAEFVHATTGNAQKILMADFEEDV